MPLPNLTPPPQRLSRPPLWSYPTQAPLPLLAPPQKLSPATVREFRAEVSIMSRLRHPNVVLFMVRPEGGGSRGVLFMVRQGGGGEGETEARGDALDDLPGEVRGVPWKTSG